MIRAPHQQQTWTHTEPGQALGVCASAPVVAQGLVRVDEADQGREAALIYLTLANVTGRSFGSGLLSRPAHGPVVARSGARLVSPLALFAIGG